MKWLFFGYSLDNKTKQITLNSSHFGFYFILPAKILLNPKSLFLKSLGTMMMIL